MIVGEGAFPSDEGHNRANCEDVHKLASSIGDPFGEARGSGVVLDPQVEAPASTAAIRSARPEDPVLSLFRRQSRTPQVQPEAAGLELRHVSNGLAHVAYATLVVAAAQRCIWTSSDPSSWSTTVSTSTGAATRRGSLSTGLRRKGAAGTSRTLPWSGTARGDNNVDHRSR